MKGKIKEVEKLLVDWKGKEMKARKAGVLREEAEAALIYHGINLALAILMKPSNQVITVDVCDCEDAECEEQTTVFCINCGLPMEHH